MKVDVIISADDIKEEKIKDKNVVVIDVLRATSVMVTALKNGCNEVIPVKEIEEALEIVNNNKDAYVLGGERQGIKIKDFNLSNSPLEYTEAVVKGKTVVMTTTNGTKAIKNSEAAGRIFIAALINGEAVAKKLLALGEDVVFVNAGTNGQFSMDDYITSGYIISLMKAFSEEEIVLTDVAETSLYISEMNPSVDGFLKKATHYRRMEDLGYFEDLRYCLTKDIIDIVPEYKDGKIIINY